MAQTLNLKMSAEDILQAKRNLQSENPLKMTAEDISQAQSDLQKQEYPSVSQGVELFGKGASKVLPESLAGIQAAAEPATNALYDLLSSNQNKKAESILDKLGIKDPSVKDFAGRKAENVLRQESLKEQFPRASKGLEIAGEFTSGIGSAALLPTAVLPAIAAAGTLGAVRHPDEYGGLSEGVQAKERLKQAATDSALMGAVSAVPTIASKLVGTGKKIASELSGIPSKEIENYIARTNQVTDLYKKSGGDFQEVADAIRKDALNAIKARRQQLSAQIDMALESAPVEKSISAQPLIDKLTAKIAKVNPNTHPKDYRALTDLLKRTEATAGESGLLNLKELKDIKEMFQDTATEAYAQIGLVNNASNVANISKSVAKDARTLLNELSPEISAANNQYEFLHNISERLGKAILKEGASPSPLMAVGSGANIGKEKLLKRLDAGVGTNIVQNARDMATAKTFLGQGPQGSGGASLLPMQATGRSLLGSAVGSALGYAVGGGPAAAIPAVLSSPLAVKTMIQASNAGKPLARKLASYSVSDPKVAASVLNVLMGSGVDKDALNFFKSNPETIESIEDPQKRIEIKQALKKRETALDRRLENQ